MKKRRTGIEERIMSDLMDAELMLMVMPGGKIKVHKNRNLINKKQLIELLQKI